MKNSIALVFLFAIWSAPMLAQEEQKARVVTFKSNPTKCVAPVAMRMIDGKLRQLPTTGFTIEPGFHTVAGDATANLGHCPTVQRRSRKSLGIPAVEWLFESGKVYYIGLDHSSVHEEEWSLIVWKVRYEDGDTIFDITRNEPED
jgi:hypothetical protein